MVEEKHVINTRLPAVGYSLVECISSNTHWNKNCGYEHISLLYFMTFYGCNFCSWDCILTHIMGVNGKIRFDLYIFDLRVVFQEHNLFANCWLGVHISVCLFQTYLATLITSIQRKNVHWMPHIWMTCGPDWYFYQLSVYCRSSTWDRRGAEWPLWTSAGCIWLPWGPAGVST